MKVELPEMITKLPEINMPHDGIRAHLIQGESNQAMICQANAGTRISEHSHAAEWGFVIEGEFEIAIGSRKKMYGKGETFFVPENARHSGYFVSDSITFHLVNEKNRFKPKDSADR